jgi:hypothetical protein
MLSTASAALSVVDLRRSCCLCHNRCCYSQNSRCHCSLQPCPGVTASLCVAPALYCRCRSPSPSLSLSLLLSSVVVVAAAVALTASSHPGPDYKTESRIPALLICCD